MMRALLAAGAALLIGAAPRSDGGPKDAGTKAWWRLTETLSSDAMEGRDAGSPGYDRAAAIVADRLAAAGLKPAGEKGRNKQGWYQSVPMEEVAVTHASAALGRSQLRFLEDFTVTADRGLPARLVAPLAYRGYCSGPLGEVKGRIVVCYGSHRAGLIPDTEAVRKAGAVGLITIADPGFTIEPPRWPFAYARTVTLVGTGQAPDSFVRITLRAGALGLLLPGHGAETLIEAGAAGKPLPSFDGGPLALGFTLAERKFSSPNIVGLLPGTDPAKAGQAIVLTAHLDGYGHGQPVNGDGLYNGTLDDAAYVALILRLLESRAGHGFARPVIALIVTGEEKGLLGSRWWVAHPTYPLARIAADINLDQLRPIFPLKRLTVHARNDSTLGDDAAAVAGAMGIAVQDDPEPERGLIRRTDHWNFMKAGIPALNFVFGYEPGSESERIYRHWYQTGYHKPQDDLLQPIDWQAAADFNRFYATLVERVADQSQVPAWKPGSSLRPAS